MPSHDKPVWLITGCSTGFGRELATLLIGRGYRVVATARDPGKVADLVAGHDAARAGAKARRRQGRPTSQAAVEAAKQKFGRIDVLVNNAGYGYLSAIEEGEDADIRAMFETNLFGLAAMTRAVLPLMRAQKVGRDRQHLLAWAASSAFRVGLLQGDEIRGRGPVRGARQGGRAVRDQGSHRRARPVPHRLGAAAR